ncbi:unnamed protein product [Dovyalis caffra]|uniref:Uncharacterized protein n=1 Tax=Dovyalis caffra TaxID=77055 RepID=A0AAV1RTM4_9ROSI|nr:unnamed protein product [Dovyalis caffra]
MARRTNGHMRVSRSDNNSDGTRLIEQIKNIKKSKPRDKAPRTKTSYKRSNIKGKEHD